MKFWVEKGEFRGGLGCFEWLDLVWESATPPTHIWEKSPKKIRFFTPSLNCDWLWLLKVAFPSLFPCSVIDFRTKVNLFSPAGELNEYKVSTPGCVFWSIVYRGAATFVRLLERSSLMWPQTSLMCSGNTVVVKSLL